jgi:magnesium transporter
MIKDKIDSFHFEDIKNKEHPSIFFKHEYYDLFILRLPMYSELNELVYKSYSFIITDFSYHYYDSQENKFVDLKDIKEFYKFLDIKIDNVLKITTDYLKKIEKIEDMMYEGKGVKEFNKEWYRYKTDLIRINRLSTKATEVLSSLMSAYKRDDDYLERNFEDINEHIQRANRSTGYLLEKLDSLYNFNLNQTNEQMNKIVYILTLLSGIFLPLNLIVGFFGMNTTTLPFTDGYGGTFKVVALLIVSGLLGTLITLFMKRK